MRIVFMGSPDFALPSLQKLADAKANIVAVITQPDRPKGRRQLLTPTPVKELALSLGLPVLQPARINAPEAVAAIRDLQADLFVVVAFGQILKKELLDMPPLGSVNVHGSLLPAYRGAAPVHWAILRGEKQTGVTTMFLNEGMDSGDMIFKAQTDILDTDDTGSLYTRLAEMGADLLLQTIRAIENGNAPAIPQEEALATYAPSLKKEDERVDWQQNAEAVWNRIRGLAPWPVAHTCFGGKRLKLLQASLLEMESCGTPGEIRGITAEGLQVFCGKGSICIHKVQPEGKAAMDAAAFCRGYRVEAGQTLG